WTVRDFQALEAPIQLLPQSWREPIAGSRGVQKPVTFVIPENQGVKISRTGCIPSDNELLPLVDAHLAPCTRASARFIYTVQALGDKTFEPMIADCLNQIRKARIQLLRLTDGAAESWKN